MLYKHDFDRDGEWIENPRLPGPSWLRKLLGPHYFDDVREVLFLEDNFFPTTVDDDDLEAIADLRSLNTLVLSHALQVTDDGLRHIRQLTDPRQLDLSGCREVTDKAMVHLAELRKLEELNLFYTEIGDAGLVHLRQMTMLKSLCLSDTQVTDEGVAQLRSALPRCEIIR